MKKEIVKTNAAPMPVGPYSQAIVSGDMDEFAAMNEVYRQFFGEEPPARTTIQAARFPLDARVEIELIARPLS
jgi:enamine deaminase RidA (YjgF/YER057c/UK114 family)